MKDGLEHNFKKALKDFELPYNAQAWESLNQKLSAKKWYQSSSLKWSAVIVIVIGIVAYFTLPTSVKRAWRETNEKTASKKTNATVVASPTQSEAAPLTAQHHTEKGMNSNEMDQLMIQSNPPAIIPNENELIPHSIPLILNQREVLGLRDQIIENQETTPSYSGGIVQFDFKSRCQGETFELAADQQHERFINYAGKMLYFGYGQSISIKLTEAGKVTLTANTGPYGQMEEFGSFEVFAAPNLALSVDRNINYEDGLPKINLTAEATDAHLSWVSNVKMDTYQGKSTNVLAFVKGIAIVEVQAIGANGCKSKEKEMINISEDYNLLAVNAFNPQSLDSRNNTFMPFALTIRQTPFKLIILDPDNGGLIFQSTDADNAWDGIDRRDGKMVPSNKAYIWKVVLQNPLAGEKGEYRGTIVRI